MAGFIQINFKIQSGAHINIQEAYQESRNLLRQSEELEAHYMDLTSEVEELMSVWRGLSATRVEEVITHRSEQARRLSENLSVISDALRQTARAYEVASKTSSSGSGSSGGGHSSGTGWHG